MLAKVISGAVIGVDGLLVEVETDIAFGLPTFMTVGLPEGAVRESKDRVKAAIKNSGYEFPNRRITVNLAPADVKKAGAGYDLPMALAARDAGLAGILVPEANSHEAAVVSGIEVIGIATLSQAVEFLAGREKIVPTAVDIDRIFRDHTTHEVDFAEVKGQEHVKRALEIAAAGGHNVLMKGPPGAGKTMVARRLPTILPDLTFEESLETTKIYSVMGLLPENRGLLTIRPFKSPHHTISDAGLIGGGCHFLKLLRHFRNYCDNLITAKPTFPPTPSLPQQGWRCCL